MRLGLGGIIGFALLAVFVSSSDCCAQTQDSLLFNTDKDTVQAGLQLQEVQVLAQRRKGDNTTSYLLNRQSLDHHQMLNLKDIATLLPGGKTINSTLTDDSRISLRSSSSERGNASFGTAVEIDGMRLDNNAMTDESMGVSTRSISSSNIESVEIITGIPSVEYGDISNGVVKVNTRRGASPFIVEASTNPRSKQIAVNKGFKLNHGVLNASLEHAQSYTSSTSPYTSYQRNALSLAYSHSLLFSSSTLNLKATVSGNAGGYNSEADPDAFAETYQKVRDNQLRAALNASWLYDGWSKGQLRLDVSGNISYADKLTTTNTNRSSSATLPMLHTMSNGYFIATSEPPGDGIFPADGYILLSPTGYWYELQYNDQKPLAWQLKAKGSMAAKHNKILLGAEYNSTRNNGKGVYYGDISYAPDWRPYRYDELPAMQNTAFYVEDRFSCNSFSLTAGLRDDITTISGSDYGTVSSLSPRVNAKYKLPFSKNLATAFHAGYGKSVKLPSFQILYPQDSYLDKLAFTPGSTADNKAFYAYNTNVTKAVYNGSLKWQYTNQFDVGTEMSWKGATMSLSFFHHTTKYPYQQVNVYNPTTYSYTSQSALETIAIPSADRQYSIDRESGVVTVSSPSTGEAVTLPYTTHYTYNYNRKFVNGSPVVRYGLEWILDLPKWLFSSDAKAASIALRFDGNYYHYKGIDQTLFAGVANGIKDVTEGSTLIGYYMGSNATSASTSATPSVSNGTMSKQCNLNATATLHIPRLRLIMTLRIESTLMNYKKQLSNADEEHRGWPIYYSTWDNPEQLLPFAENYEAARASGDVQTKNDLQQLIKLTPTDYYFNPQKLSSFYSANISVTKEIGKWLSISFYANNFLNSMQKVYNSQTGLEQSVYNSGYVPKFYYGMAVRVRV